MAVSENAKGGDAEVKRLREQLKQTQLRLEEVTNYYRGEIEAVRKRSEDQLLQVQADEAARRRRAEEQASELSAELKSARSEADKASRRYQALLNRIEAIEAESRAEVRAERDRYEDSARAAWQTAEEEVERLNGELAELQRELANERHQREQIEQAKTDLEAAYERRDAERQQLIDRLKRALKASEQRREALDTVGASEPAASADGVASAGSRGAEQQVEVDPSAGWGRFQLGEGDDIADEFLRIQADRSFDAEQQPPAASQGASEPEAEGESTPPAPSDGADDEAERLIMGVAVDRKVAQRQTDEPDAVAGAGGEPSAQPGDGSRPASHQPPVPEPEPSVWRRRGVRIAAAGIAAVGTAAAAVIAIVM